MYYTCAYTHMYIHIDRRCTCVFMRRGAQCRFVYECQPFSSTGRRHRHVSSKITCSTKFALAWEDSVTESSSYGLVGRGYLQSQGFLGEIS